MKSMTGYAALDRDDRRWELRSVNARGFDLRLRLPDRPAGLDPAARMALAPVARGNVTLSMRLSGRGGPSSHALGDAARALREAEVAADEVGLDMRPATAADLLTLAASGRGESEVPLAEAVADLDDLVAAFDAD
ncbi:MAG: YicC/YloC family endoribonuclease, partial [Pseudomonadota bacterium]